MRIALASVLATFIPTLAAADTLPYPHNQHPQCHTGSPLVLQNPTCKAILEQEANDFRTYALSLPKTTLALDDGTSATGTRQPFVRQIPASSTSHDFTEWSQIYRTGTSGADDASLHPDWEDNSIGSCFEYTYKRYYEPNRYLDLLGLYSNQRRYDKALDIIHTGIPAVGAAKLELPLVNLPLVDYDYRPIEPFDISFSNPAYDALAPLRTGTQPRNEFFNLSTLFGTNADPTDTAFATAFAASQASRYVTYPSTGEFGRAEQMRHVADIASLSASQVEDIARRLTAMRAASAAALHQYGQCIVDTFVGDSLVGPSVTGKAGAELAKYLEQMQPSAGYTYPIDQGEVDLQAKLLDPTLANATLSSVVNASPTGTDLWAHYARTPTGSLVRFLASLDAAGATRAVSTESTSLKSLTYKAPSCDLRASFKAVRDLLVAEYARGAAGCMGTSQRCDFSAPLFIEDIKSRLQDTLVDANLAQTTCEKLAGATLFDASTLYPAPPTLARSSVAKFEAYLHQQYGTVLAVLRDTPRTSSLPNAAGERKSGGASWGDKSLFAAGYTYAGEWGVNGIQKDAAGNTCRLGGKVEGSLQAYAYALGSSKETLVDAHLVATTAQPSGTSFTAATYSAKLNVLGGDIFTPVDNAPLADFDPASKEDSYEFTIIQTYIPVGPFVINLKVAADFEWGYSLDLGIDQSACVSPPSNPTLSLSGTLKPHAGADAKVSLGLDLIVAGVGFSGKVTLVDASLPFTAALNTTSTGTGLSVTASSDLDLILSELSGSISLYITVFEITVFEQELFSWTGFHQTHSLWHDAVTLSPAALNYL